ncbi:MAG: hypothetical protein GY778_27720, partial [bacterium]|nr:hypothetical protein [bacterium]
MKKHGRPVLCTEWMARALGSKIETDLPLFKREEVGCYMWGLVNGRAQFQFPWWNKPNGPLHEAGWFHDILHKDGTPYRVREIEAIRKTTADRSIDWSVAYYSKPRTRFNLAAHAEDGIQFSDGWTRWVGAGPAKGRLHYSNESGRKAEIVFDGTGLILIHKVGPDCGLAGVLIDGQPAATP